MVETGPEKWREHVDLEVMAESETRRVVERVHSLGPMIESATWRVAEARGLSVNGAFRVVVDPISEEISIAAIEEVHQDIIETACNGSDPEDPNLDQLSADVNYLRGISI